MKYHLKVDGNVIKPNLSKSKAFKYLDLIKLYFPECEVSILVTESTACFTEDVDK